MFTSKTLPIIALVLALFVITNCKGKKKTDDETLANNVDTMEFPAYDEFMPDEKGTNLPDTNVANNTVVDTTQKEPVLIEDKQGNLKPENVTTSDAGNFYIVVGSFTVYENASKLMDVLKKKGYAPIILPPYGKYNRVAIKQYSSRETARTEIDNFKSKLKDNSYWILKRE